MRYNQALMDLIHAIIYFVLGSIFGTILAVTYILRTGGF